jgi:hypothetical protein
MPKIGPQLPIAGVIRGTTFAVRDYASRLGGQLQAHARFR